MDKQVVVAFPIPNIVMSNVNCEDVVSGRPVRATKYVRIWIVGEDYLFQLALFEYEWSKLFDELLVTKLRLCQLVIRNDAVRCFDIGGKFSTRLFYSSLHHVLSHHWSSSPSLLHSSSSSTPLL